MNADEGAGRLPDDAVIGLADEDFQFILAYARGDVTEAEFRARYERDGRIAIPVVHLPDDWPLP